MRIIIEGRFADSKGITRKQVEYDSSTFIITRVGKKLGKPHFCFGDSEIIFPSFIDIHTHCREDLSKLNLHKEDFQTASNAAINGGICVIGDMPNNPIPPSTTKSYLRKKELSKKSKVPVVLYGAITSESFPLEVDAPYKYFMGPTTGAEGGHKDTVLKRYRGKCVSFHCEDPNYFVKSSSHHFARPVISEVVSIKKAIELIELYELEGIICHISSHDGLKLCIDAKRRGVNLKIEVSPHHLLLNWEETGHNPLYQVNPPIRKKDEQKYLLSQLKKGNIDFIGSDHAPHLLSEKTKGVSGLPGLDTYSLSMGELISKHKIPAEIIYRCCAENPGKWANRYIEEQVGRIAVGNLASFTVFNFNKKYTVTSESLKTKCSWSHYENKEFPLSISTLGRFQSERLDLN